MKRDDLKLQRRVADPAKFARAIRRLKNRGRKENQESVSDSARKKKKRNEIILASRENEY